MSAGSRRSWCVLASAALPRLSPRGALRRRASAVPQFSIRDLPEGQPGRLAGMVAAVGPVLTAPVSGRACVYYEVAVRRHRGLETTDWLEFEHQVLAETRSVRFALDDGTGRTIIDPSHVELLIGCDVDHWYHPGDPETAAEEALLARHTYAPRGLLFAKRLRFTESIIEVGERIAVVGIATREPDPDAPPSPEYRGAPATRPRLTGTVRHPIFLSDEPALAPPHDDEGPI